MDWTCICRWKGLSICQPPLSITSLFRNQANHIAGRRVLEDWHGHCIPDTPLFPCAATRVILVRRHQSIVCRNKPRISLLYLNSLWIYPVTRQFFDTEEWTRKTPPTKQLHFKVTATLDQGEGHYVWYSLIALVIDYHHAQHGNRRPNDK